MSDANNEGNRCADQRESKNGQPASPPASRCAVRRIGRVLRLADGAAEIEVNGKIVRMPSAKLAADVAAGDCVSWNGSSWVRIGPA